MFLNDWKKYFRWKFKLECQVPYNLYDNGEGWWVGKVASFLISSWIFPVPFLHI